MLHGLSAGEVFFFFFYAAVLAAVRGLPAGRRGGTDGRPAVDASALRIANDTPFTSRACKKVVLAAHRRKATPTRIVAVIRRSLISL